jgi:membrane associated rhomboid family serine protease
VGIYDRDYYREERPGSSFPHAPQTVVGWLIAVNVAVWLADAFTGTTDQPHWLCDLLTLRVGTLTDPLHWWQFLTAGFNHDPRGLQHILFNMLTLFFLGRDVEAFYGSKEFLRLYLVMLVFANIAWAVVDKLAGAADNVGVLGASGAIAGVVVLYAMNFPRRTLLLFFVIPVPAWLAGALVVAYDMYGAMGGQWALRNVAYTVHLAGAAFAFIYCRRGWNLTRLSSGFAWPSFRRKPTLRVHMPEEEAPSDLSAEVDRILEKIYREGEASLTAKERKFLETASREYQRKNKN